MLPVDKTAEAQRKHSLPPVLIKQNTSNSYLISLPIPENLKNNDKLIKRVASLCDRLMLQFNHECINNSIDIGDEISKDS